MNIFKYVLLSLLIHCTHVNIDAGEREMNSLINALNILNIKIQWKKPITEADLFK